MTRKNRRSSATTGGRSHSVVARSSADSSASATASAPTAFGAGVKLAGSVGGLFVADKWLEHALCAAGVTFPSALIGMFGVLTALLVTERVVGEEAANEMVGAVSPALSWIASWLPVFYVPSLVVTPLVVTKIAPSALVKVLAIVVVGFVTTIAFSATSANAIRGMTGTTLLPQPAGKPAPPTEAYVYKLWGGALAVAAVSAMVSGENAAKVITMVAATVCSFLVGNTPKIKAKMNPIVTTALSNIAAARRRRHG